MKTRSVTKHSRDTRESNSRTHIRGWSTAALIVFGASLLGAEKIEVSPGALVGWPGEGVEACGLGDQRWAPMGQFCWFPVDLLAPQGELVVLRWRHGVKEEQTVEIGSYPYEVQHITLKDDSQVNLSAENLARVRRENSKIAALWDRESLRRFELPLGRPLNPLPSGGRFGSRRFFNHEPRSPHTGTDYSADTGSPILAVAAGTVALTGDFFFPGKSVFVDHGDGLISMYFHMSGIAVDQGEEVEKGEILGLVGESGRATGPHLHFGIRWHGARVDPTLLMEPPSQLPILP